MRTFFSLTLCLLWLPQLFAQDSLNMTRLARWDDDSLPVASPQNLKVQYSGCWGLAVNDHEYAILGGARHVLIFDVTAPTKPSLVGKFEGSTNTVWREFKSYKNRVYGVSDGTNEGLMIFDFSNAPDTIKRTYFSNELFSSAHTITLDTASGRIYLNGSSAASSGLLVLDISQNPDQPTLLSKVSLSGGYIHDSYVRNDTVYASSTYNGYYIYDYTDANNPKTLASIPPTGGYQHSSWLSQDGKYAFAVEEIPSGRPILVIDVQDIGNNNIEVVHSFLDPLISTTSDINAIPHNLYIKDNLLFVSQYEDGLIVYDISNPLMPVRIGFYDTHPQNTQYNTYYGCWGNYPWLPSGTIIAGDMQNGLQLLRLNNISNAQTIRANSSINIFPNPTLDNLTLKLSDSVRARRLRLINSTGHILYEKPWPDHSIPSTELNLGELPTGIYFVQLIFDNGDIALKKVIKR